MHNTARPERFVRRDVRMWDSLQSLVQRTGEPDGVSAIARINRDELPDLTKSQTPLVQRLELGQRARDFVNLRRFQPVRAERCREPCSPILRSQKDAASNPVRESRPGRLLPKSRGLRIPLPLASAALKTGSGIAPINHAPRERIPCIKHDAVPRS